MTELPKNRECLKKVILELENAKANLDKSYNLLHHPSTLLYYRAQINNIVSKIGPIKNLIKEISKLTNTIENPQKNSGYPANQEEWEELIKSHSEEVKTNSKNKSNATTQNQIDNDKIAKLTEEQCGKILLYINHKLNTTITNDSLKTHTIEDKWCFTFIAKIVTLIQNTLGTKTSEEKILEQLIKETGYNNQFKQT